MESTENENVPRPVATSHDTEQYTVSVSEAAELFTAAGLPRTERAIQRFCKRGDLICAFVDTPFGNKYLIRRSSIERLIEQKLQAQTFTSDQDGRDVSRPDATSREQSRQDLDPVRAAGGASEPQMPNDSRRISENESHDSEQRQGATGNPELENKVKKLEEENLNLKIDNRGKEAFINHLVNERKDMTVAMQEVSYKLGATEARLQLLEAPKQARQSLDTSDDMPRHVATEAPEPSAIIAEPSEPPAAAAAKPEPQPEQKRSWWRW